VDRDQERRTIDLGLTAFLGTLTAIGSADGRRAVVVRDNLVKVWDVRTKRCLATLEQHTSHVVSVDLTANGETVASGDREKEGGQAILWNWDGGRGFPIPTGHTGPVKVRFSPDGKTLATGSAKDEFVKLWDTGTRKERDKLLEHTKGVVELRFSPDGQTLAVRCGDQSVKLWRVAPATATSD
jgi:WD40 repeat protein